MTTPFDSDRLRDAFTDAAHDISPSRVPLAAIKAAGHEQRRKRAAGLAGACVLLLVPLAATAVEYLPSTASHITATPAAPAVSARMTVPNERVTVAPGAELWLTKDGLHWSTPQQFNQFRSLTEGNVPNEASVSLYAEPIGDVLFLAGAYRASTDAAAVRIETTSGTVNGTIVRLTGKSGWGAWYATSPLAHSTATPQHGTKEGSVLRITVLNGSGNTLASMVPRA
ncbi:hypothetical protein [Streptomyces sp. NPDC058701]|uniref:hypothetical protein n=1 Tax=Streptomyces sp. NPDC058701 TaxID=3346608 RepID=UPI00365D9C63